MNGIIEELKAYAALDLGSAQNAFYKKQLEDAKPITCTPLNKVFTKRELAMISALGIQKKECYRNAALLCALFPNKVSYVEGIASSYGFNIEHAFNRVGGHYVDVTFEKALGLDVTRENYVALCDLDFKEMKRLAEKTRIYGNYYREKYIETVFNK